jgi:hypothetical protein
VNEREKEKWSMKNEPGLNFSRKRRATRLETNERRKHTGTKGRWSHWIRNRELVVIKNRAYNLCDQSWNVVDWPQKYFDEGWSSSYSVKQETDS